MQYLVRHISYLVVSRFQCVNRKVENGYDKQLPTPSEAYEERDRIQDTMDEQVIPILSLRFCEEWRLEEIISNQVT